MVGQFTMMDGEIVEGDEAAESELGNLMWPVEGFDPQDLLPKAYYGAP